MTKPLVLTGDALAVLRRLPARCVHCCITSPPYWGLRDYKADGQLGLESTPEAYTARLVEVFREVRRVLRDDGTLWLNLGDSYNAGRDGGHAGGRGSLNSGRDLDEIYAARSGANAPGLKPKDLVGIPWRVAFALQADGWWLRQDIIWHKPNPMPESVRDRCTKAHEYLFLLSKSERYYFDADAIAEPAATGFNGSEFHTGKTGEHQHGRASKQPRFGGTKYGDSDDPKHATKSGNEYTPNGTRNRRSVWTIPPKAYKGAHFATFPPALVEPCILAGTSEKGCCSRCGAPAGRAVHRKRTATRPGADTKVTGDRATEGNRDPQRHVTTRETTGWTTGCHCNAPLIPCTVLDPFVGSGTTLATAVSLGRHSIGIDLNPDYLPLIHERIAKAPPCPPTPPPPTPARAD